MSTYKKIELIKKTRTSKIFLHAVIFAIGIIIALFFLFMDLEQRFRFESTFLKLTENVAGRAVSYNK